MYLGRPQVHMSDFNGLSRGSDRQRLLWQHKATRQPPHPQPAVMEGNCCTPPRRYLLSPGRGRIAQVLSLLFSLALTACAGWSRTDKAMMGSFVAGQAINYGQVVYVCERDDWHELNPMVDEIWDKSGKIGILSYKLVSTGLVYLAADRLPKYRTEILGASNVIVWSVVSHDLAVGVGWRF